MRAARETAHAASISDNVIALVETTLGQTVDREAHAAHLTLLATAPSGTEEIVDAEVEDSDANAPASSTALAVRAATSSTVAVRRLLKAEEYLAGPVKYKDDGTLTIGKWTSTNLAGQAASASVAGASDHWPIARGGEAMPKSYRGRLSKAAKTAVEDGRRPALVVKAAIGTPIIATAFEDAWNEVYGTPPLARQTGAVIFDAFDMVSQGCSWEWTLQAVRAAAAEGHTYVQRVYTDLTTAQRRRPQRGVGSAPTQGQEFLGAMAKAQMIQQQRDAQNGAAA